ncbi:MAG: hypothetical protein AAFV49_00560 [Pseudomonadota bacterium]
MTIHAKPAPLRLAVTALALCLPLLAAPAAAQSVRDEIEALRRQVDEANRALEAALQRIDELETKQEETQEQVAEIPKPRVRPGRKNVDLEVYGHINQAFAYFDNGQTSRFDVVDNDNSGSRLGFRGRYKSGDWSAGVRLEASFEVNTTDELTFDSDSDLGTLASSDDGESDFLSVRHADTFFSHKDYGTISLGFGPIATEGVSETDLSGTTLISESDVDDIGGEFQFGNDDNAQLGSGFEVDDFFSNLDGSRDSRIRYATPRFAGVQGVVVMRVDDDENGVGQFFPDASLNYEGEVSGFEVEAQGGYRREDGSNTFIASASTLAPFGTSLTLGGGVETFDGTNPPDAENFVFVKLGQQLDLFEFGKTKFSVDFFRGQDNSQADPFTGEQTEAISVGGGVVQEVKPLGAEVFAAGRFYDVDIGDGTDTDSLFVLFTGARVRF